MSGYFPPQENASICADCLVAVAVLPNRSQYARFPVYQGKIKKIASVDHRNAFLLGKVEQYHESSDHFVENTNSKSNLASREF